MPIPLGHLSAEQGAGHGACVLWCPCTYSGCAGKVFLTPSPPHSKEDVACVHHSISFPSINMRPPDAAYKDAPFHDVKVHDGGKQ